jgi:hypothetical protein
MRFIDMQGFCVKLDRQVEFQRWLIENEQRIKASYPEGSEFGGIYAAVLSSEKGSGEYYWLDILDSYGAMDRAAALAKEGTSDYAMIAQEFMQFLDSDRSAGWSRTLLKSVADATIFDAPAG